MPAVLQHPPQPCPPPTSSLTSSGLQAIARGNTGAAPQAPLCWSLMSFPLRSVVAEEHGGGGFSALYHPVQQQSGSERMMAFGSDGDETVPSFAIDDDDL